MLFQSGRAWQAGQPRNRGPAVPRSLQSAIFCLAFCRGLSRVGISIKSDKWIRRMAEQHGMIEPFEAG
jgi:hypothetical protein